MPDKALHLRRTPEGEVEWLYEGGPAGVWHPFASDWEEAVLMTHGRTVHWHAYSPFADTWTGKSPERFP